MKPSLYLVFTLTAAIGTLLGSPNLAARQRAGVERPVISERAVRVEAIQPVASDGFSGEAFLRKPPGDGPFPAVVLIHGGTARWSTEELRDFAVHIHASRFLEAGYVVVTITRRDLDLGLPPSAEQGAVLDVLAAIDYVMDLPYVDSESVVLRGTSVGGYLALEAGAARDVAAILVEEPFSMPFVGVSGSGGAAVEAYRTSGNDEKIRRLSSPLMLIRGDQTPNINDFNREVFIPAVRAAGKSLDVETYPGELHSFAFYNNSERTPRPAVALEAFVAMDMFFRDHLRVQPQPLESRMVDHVAIE